MWKKNQNILSYFLNYIMDYFAIKLKPHQEVIISKLDGTSFHITSTTRILLDTLYSDHEVADIRMFVCAAHISSTRNVNRLIIRSPDTDVAVIACYHSYHSLRNSVDICFYTGFGKKHRRFIPIHQISNSMGATLCNMLPIFHCLTGCDSTASFSGIGKKKAFAVPQAKKNEFHWLAELGERAIDVNDDSFKDAIKFICWLYDSKCQELDINALRHKLFCQNNFFQERNYRQHLMPYYACIPLLNLPSLVENGGWKYEDYHLVQNLMTQDAKLDSPS